MRIELKPAPGVMAHYVNTQYMAFSPDEEDPMNGIYGFGASYEEALQDYLKRVDEKQEEYCEHSGVKLGFAVTPEKLADMMRDEWRHECNDCGVPI